MREVEVGLERVDLPPVGVAPHTDVHELETALVGDAVDDLLGDQDRSGARAPDSHARVMALADRLVEAVAHHRAWRSRSTPRPG